ncbi:Leo1-like protein-domain-containing protein [Crassisporium funariophilum]|nr:Leo1-like protein-domain-containing protein [Crassisporium funariophilum]
MSSLAGALDDHQSISRPNVPSDDVEMTPAMPSSPENDSEPHEDEDQDEEMSDLFGNDNDVVEQKHVGALASPTASGPDSERLPSPERERRQALEYEEEDAPPEIAVEVKEAEVAFPNLPVPRSSDGDNWVIRIPNFVKLDTKPFHPDTYIGPEHDEEETTQHDNVREKSMSIKLKVENTVRWRWTKDASGQERRVSNSRVVRWSDGSLSLLLGKELFDINQSIDTSANVTRQTLGASQSQSQTNLTSTPTPSGKTQGQGLTYLVAQHKRSQVLQSEAVITGYMSLRPTGMQSETHRMLVRAVGQRHNKVARLKIAPEPTIDPERELKEQIKQNAKKSKKKADVLDGLGGGRKRRGHRRTTDHDVMWSDDDDEGGDMYGATDEEDDDGLSRRGSPRKMKRKASAEEKGGEDYQADDFVVPDDSEEDEGGPSRKRPREASEMEEDPLDRMEANLEQQAAEKKRAEKKTPAGKAEKKKKEPDDDDDTEEEAADPMDVESEEEEEEEEFKVRRVSSKRAIAFDEDEDNE